MTPTNFNNKLMLPPVVSGPWARAGAAILALAASMAVMWGLMELPSPFGLNLAVALLFSVAALVGFFFQAPVSRLYVACLAAGFGFGLLMTAHPNDVAIWAIFSASSFGLAEGLSRATSRLRVVAATDPLTDLPNRTGLWQAFDRAVAVSHALGQPLTLVHIDLDGFKEINDRSGHAEGDRILRRCAEVWRSMIRTGDTLARVGGDEFLLVLPGSNQEDAADLVDRLQDRSPVEFCYGTAELRAGEDIKACVARADRELYLAKAERIGPAGYSDGQAR